jgi:vacuolar-type H+-ATPase subunit I/STV1
MELPKDIKDEIWEYCRVNDISGVDDFIIKMVKQGFTSEKFGSVPWEKEAEIKEVQVIKEVEKIVEREVPVEVIKEVEKIVEKEVFVTDEEANLELKKQIEVLENDIKKIQETSNILSKENGERGATIQELNGKISDLTNEVEQLKEELEAEKNKPKAEDDDEIYGEGKKGFFGSNISDLWNKKK